MLEFPTGITALVGPNGSGKSNVVDAIRWCLGEQNSRDLRGQRAEDVVHAGRQRVLGSAESSLVFESEPDDGFDWSELSVSRRLYRSGESEYLVNGSRRRLRDVQTTMRSLGVENPRFIVVNQGMTDFLLSATPTERRALLEQAAGLSGYRQRREEASHKLAATEQNIVTAEVVLAELEPQLRALRRQARAVQERDELEEHFRARLSRWYGSRWRGLDCRIAEQAAELAAASSQRAELTQETDVLESAAEGSLERERSWRAQLEAATAALHASQRELDGNVHEVERLAQRAAGLSDHLEQLTRRAKQVALDSASSAQQTADAGRMRDSLEQETQRLAADLSSAQRVSHEVEGALSLAEIAMSDAVQRAREADDGKHELQRKIYGLQLDLDHLARRSESIVSRLATASKRRNDVVSTLRAERSRGHEIAGEESRCSAELEDLALAADGAARRAMRLAALRGRLEAQSAGLSQSLSEIKGTHARLERDMGDAIVTHLRIPAGWNRAVVSALGEWASVPHVALRTIPAEDAPGFFAWRRDLQERAELSGEWADMVVESSAPLPAILCSSLLVENDQDAAQVWKTLSDHRALTVGSPPVQIVARSGLCLSGIGRRSHPAEDRATRFLDLKHEASLLARRLERVVDRKRRAGAALEESRTKAAELEQLREQAQARLTMARRAASEEAAGLRQLEDRLSQIGSDRSAREEEQKEIGDQTTEIRERLEAAEGQLALLVRQGAALKEREGEARHVVASRKRQLQDAESRLQAVRRALDETSARLAAQGQVVVVLQRDYERLEAERDRLAEEERSIRTNLESTLAGQQGAQQRASDLEAVVAEQVDRVAEIRGCRPTTDGTREVLREARTRSAAAVGRHERALARMQELEGERVRLSVEIMRELGTRAAELPGEGAEDVPTEDEIRRLRSRVIQHADLDEAIVGEYRELADRNAYLCSQLADLREAAKGLREIMDVADAEMRIRYQSALASVSQEFRDVFRVMLRGGEACLQQVDDDGGIEVEATLPGKRTRSNAAFSGGERALVGTSLLFAVLRIRPSPFCVLDEVDAALDETNVDRYLAALRQISARTQVITVTHNRATMAAANALYGLTMDGDGASSVLSVRLDSYEAAG